MFNLINKRHVRLCVGKRKLYKVKERHMINSCVYNGEVHLIMGNDDIYSRERRQN